MPTKSALITGICGQDGRYLSELLLSKGYEVHGTIASRAPGVGEADENLFYWDLSDGTNLQQIFKETQPDEVYNLAAQSHVRLSFELPIHTANVTGVGTLRVLEAIRQFQETSGKQIRFYQASSSEMFGQVKHSPQNEDTPFHPRSPYACAKVFGFWQTVNYRESYGMFACNGILFNHESPFRGEAFVTRKITRAAARIKVGLQQKLKLGNTQARRDWGFAGDYVDAMWKMMQQDEADDFVVATGVTHSVQDFLEIAFGHLDLDLEEVVETDQSLFRPAEVDTLCGDASKAREKLGWEPKVSFEELVRMMVDRDLKIAERDAASR
ncbi:MAG: GDP-mannose 4,6-dehydratase [Planctomycetota bacterium]|mgnify:FL=1|nr:GDP-mannose 4,6-dehydratase [Planctomycetota bacterium]MDA1248961.1 GDP-mannose 4,6-dehydratase [Planctomycetota bacterium]